MKDELINPPWVTLFGGSNQLMQDVQLDREALYEDESFPERELAALVVARIYYHLQEYNESMVFALGAGKLLDLDRGGEFEETIICEQ